MTTPVCSRCGSPWFEPHNGGLRCCDCDTPFGTSGTESEHTDGAAQ